MDYESSQSRDGNLGRGRILKQFQTACRQPGNQIRPLCGILSRGGSTINLFNSWKSWGLVLGEFESHKGQRFKVQRVSKKLTGWLFCLNCLGYYIEDECTLDRFIKNEQHFESPFQVTPLHHMETHFLRCQYLAPGISQEWTFWNNTFGSLYHSSQMVWHQTWDLS